MCLRIGSSSALDDSVSHPVRLRLVGWSSEESCTGQTTGRQLCPRLSRFLQPLCLSSGWRVLYGGLTISLFRPPSSLLTYRVRPLCVILGSRAFRRLEFEGIVHWPDNRQVTVPQAFSIPPAFVPLVRVANPVRRTYHQPLPSSLLLARAPRATPLRLCVGPAPCRFPRRHHEEVQSPTSAPFRSK
jgi:hypothetical protein